LTPSLQSTSRAARRAVTAASLLLALAISGCALPLPGRQGGAAQRGEAGSARFSWRVVTESDLPAAVRDWVAERRNQAGLFRHTAGDTTYVLVSWGERLTAGYRVRIEELQPAGPGRLLLVVTLQDPRPGERPARTATHPHAVAAVQPAADYELLPVFRGTHFLQNAAFEVMEPLPYTQVDERVRIRGRARVFEAMFRARVEDAAGTLVERPVQASEGAPGWGEFDVELPLGRPPRGELRLVLYEPSAKDGSPIHVLTVPLRPAGR
jgi:hypothetical protein